MDDKFKNTIRNSVLLYKDIFQDEYVLFKRETEQARHNLKNADAEVIFDDFTNEGIKRELFRMPEKLYTIIINNVSEQDWPVLDSKEYAAWFMKEFPEFRMSQTI